MERSIEIGKEVLEKEASAISSVILKLDEDFERAVKMMHEAAGLVIVIGMGKSGHIGKKISATLTSMGTRSIFLHPGEGTHGDLGIISENDVCLILSHSGNTEEITRILPLIKKRCKGIIAIVSTKKCRIAEKADFVIRTYVDVEADPNNLAPTSSSTVTLALGDALAVALMKMKDFGREDFAQFHPGGALGKQLLLKVEDIMATVDDLVTASGDTPIHDVLFEMTEKKLGFVVIVDQELRILGIITDGDIRRIALNAPEKLNMHCEEIMSRNPQKIRKDILAYDALKLMRSSNISCLLVQEDERLIGGIDMKEILRAGLR